MPAKQKKTEEIEPMKMVRLLPCNLSDAEVRRRREQLVTTLGEIEQQQEALADVKCEYKQVLRDLEDHKSEVLKQIRERSETRPIECEERRVFAQNCIQVVRKDSGAVIEERPMKMEDRQLEIGGQNGEAHP